MRPVTFEHPGAEQLPRTERIPPEEAAIDEPLQLANAAQDKLFLPGIRKLKRLVDSGFFGRILSVRGEFGYWVFEGDWGGSPRSVRRGTTARKTAAASSPTCSATGATCSITPSAR